MSQKDLPPQSVLMSTCLRPGRPVELILDTSLDQNQIDVRPALLHDLDPKGRLVLSQTAPPLGRRWIGRQVEITFLARYLDVPGGRWLRVGYRAPIADLVADYRLDSTRVESVIIAPKPQKLQQTTIRLAFRLTPSAESHLSLCFRSDDNPLGILDISAGGARFSHPDAWSFTPGQKLNLVLKSREEVLDLPGQVIRSGEKEGPSVRGLSITAVQFMIQDLATRQRLGQLLQKELRRQLARRSGLS
ncbi:hypothetical protein AAU61_15515 [Desulfocarbo indianensis]|nr:hypothetical protein AAU61_15515 [Desulfocarbo indianensis]